MPCREHWTLLLNADSWLQRCTACVCVCLHVCLNFWFRSPYIEWIAVLNWNAGFCNALLAPGWYFCERKLWRWLRTLFCHRVGVFVAKMMDYTGNKRKGPLGNNDPFIRKQWLQMLDWLICMMDEPILGTWVFISFQFVYMYAHILSLFGILKQCVSKLLHASESCLLYKPGEPNTHLLAGDQF